jgi:hypothetical protein
MAGVMLVREQVFKLMNDFLQPCCRIAALVVLSATLSARAQSWTRTSAPDQTWACVSCSADGNKLLATAGYYGGVYISTNFGATWVAATLPSNNWGGAASSTNGSELLVAAEGGPIYRSSDGGLSWVPTGAPSQGWYSVASSADGNNLIAGSYLNVWTLYTSQDFGLTWTPATNANFSGTGWNSVASSADGTSLAAVGQFHLVITSADSGATWTTNTLPEYLYSVASSADGATLAVAGDGLIYTSADAGLTWQPSGAPTNGWISIACSADGSRLVAGSSQIYVSTNGGALWTAADAPIDNWRAVASSADGSKLVAVGNGGIYTWAEIPVLTVTALGGSVNLSWPATSSGSDFRLETSPTALPGGSWTSVTNAVVLSGGTFSVSVTPDSPSAFYRLHKRLP